MKGLIIKDLLNLKKQFNKKDIFIGVFLFIFLNVTFKEISVLIGSIIILFIASGYCTTLAFCDIKVNWKEYQDLLPLSIWEIVGARYIVTIGIEIFLFVVCLLFNILFYNRDYQYWYILYVIFGVIYVQMLIALPTSIIKNGTSSSNVMMVFLAISLILYWLIQWGNISLEGIITFMLLHKEIIVILSLLAIVLATILSLIFTARNYYHEYN